MYADDIPTWWRSYLMPRPPFFKMASCKHSQTSEPSTLCERTTSKQYFVPNLMNSRILICLFLRFFQCLTLHL